MVSLVLCTALLCCGCVQTAPEEDQTKVTPLPGTSYAGTGNASETVQMDAGLYRFAMTSNGSGPFVFEVENPDTYGLLAHGEGPYSGTQVFGIYENGTYNLNVTAAGPWSVNVQQAAVEAGHALPFAVNGSGDDVAGWIDLPLGETEFDVANDGTSFFAACLYNQTGHPVMDPTGTYQQPVHGNMGAYNGTVTVYIPEKGPYYLNIVSDGNWSVSVS
ncbi:hypothetical protein RJ40_05755 [Methanofollis aquaemaris]|uniref:Peptidase C-terminal archaeal/bacterial domain-containing protein n=1 Tax=Methanofollis aquaemaris TaxID=126734 RepID=A0A8A3S5Y5_9EURY|nr:hypothetical protein [Methanofollis aquaemaris]QSZ67034.1 hypothetical protein RJ40_05755 [Methanofollis aquaemaris]